MILRVRKQEVVVSCPPSVNVAHALTDSFQAMSTLSRLLRDSLRWPLSKQTSPLGPMACCRGRGIFALGSFPPRQGTTFCLLQQAVNANQRPHNILFQPNVFRTEAENALLDNFHSLNCQCIPKKIWMYTLVNMCNNVNFTPLKWIETSSIQTPKVFGPYPQKHLKGLRLCSLGFSAINKSSRCVFPSPWLFCSNAISSSFCR